MKYIPLTNGALVKVDDCDFAELSKNRWLHLNGRYAQRTYSPNGSRLMHRIIMNAPAGLQVDHINGDTLDNRRSNLRLATAHLNMANRKLGIGNRSGYKGVSRHRSTGKWQARIQVNGRQIWLGLFTDLIDAADAYDKAAKAYFGQYARTNS